MIEKRNIKVSPQQLQELMKKFNVKMTFVRCALRYERNSERAKKIRTTALKMEGVKEVVILDAKEYKSLVK